MAVAFLSNHLVHPASVMIVCNSLLPHLISFAVFPSSRRNTRSVAF
uniref:Uncharacterized protein n=1 Tax=Parascaris equorum TaxID=6256 RepID=A0A914RYW3_PAREQ